MNWVDITPFRVTLIDFSFAIPCGELFAASACHEKVNSASIAKVLTVSCKSPHPIISLAVF